MARRAISVEEDSRLIFLILEKNDYGDYLNTQRQIQKATGISRQYIRRLAKRNGREFIKTIDVEKSKCVCVYCGKDISRSKSRILASKKNFCDRICQMAHFSKKKREQNVVKDETVVVENKE